MNAMSNPLRKMAALAAAAVLSAAVIGQDGVSGGASPLKLTVSDVGSAEQVVRVPANKSVMVDFSQPVREVRVAKADIAEVAAVTPRQILVTGRSFGTTQMIVWLNETDQRVFDLVVDLDLDRLVASLRTAVPRANVRAHAVMDSVVLTGTVPDADSAQRMLELAGLYARNIVNHVKVAGVQQVLLRCTVAEVNRRAVRQLGFNGWIAGDNVRDMFGISNLNGINPANIGAAEGVNVRGRIPFLVGENGIPVTGTPSLSFGFPRVQMQVFVQALRENGLLRVLAEPNLVTVNGSEANFLAGGEFPIPVPQSGGSGGTTITIDYREFGVRLRFTPAILGDGIIRLQVAPEVSEPDFSSAVTIGGFVVPGLVNRRVETVVELGDGQTFAIGGLLSERVRGTSRKIPALGDIPILGSLFSSVEYQSDETELVILVTPELVEPLSPNQITSIPGSQMVHPNDYELFVEGKLEGHNPEVSPMIQRPSTGWPVRAAELHGAKNNEPLDSGHGGGPAAIGRGPAKPIAARLHGPVGPAGGDETW
ncbi:MAG: type II and III secretion system protein family protein [Phycisphaerales bacterium]|nr:type II and III secretion system protein family protein [Phycisphaerales bacterium]